VVVVLVLLETWLELVSTEGPEFSPIDAPISAVLRPNPVKETLGTLEEGTNKVFPCFAPDVEEG